MMLVMRPIRYLIIHCSASPNGVSLYQYKTPQRTVIKTPAQTIDVWHQERGFRRTGTQAQRFNPELKAIGYHLVIGLDGTLFTGRALEEIGAHAVGHNAHSIGICLVGTDRFTSAQWQSLKNCVQHLCTQFSLPLVEAQFSKNGLLVNQGICGHRDIPQVHKTCPGFAVADWLAQGLQTLPNHLVNQS